MSVRPRDTTPEAWAEYHAALDRMGGEMRLRAALELSESVRSIHLAGILSRHPGWSDAEAVRHLISEVHGIELLNRW